MARLFLLGALNWTAQWYRPGGRLSLDKVAEQAAAVFLQKPLFLIKKKKTKKKNGKKPNNNPQKKDPERGSDEALYGAMVGADDRGNRLRQSPPYAGMLPRDVLERLREEIAA